MHSHSLILLFSCVHQYLKERLVKDIRPLLNQDDTMHVNVSLELIKIEGIDAKSQILSVTLGIALFWNYETLRWNRTEFGNVSSVTVSENDVWLPDIAITNAIKNSYEFYKSEMMKVTVYYTGWAYWWSAGNFDISCRINIRNYPFDTQVCPINVSNFYSTDEFQMLHRPRNTIGLSVYDENDEWKVLRSFAESIDYINNYSKLTYIITVQRRSLYYLLSIVLPVLMVSFMNTLSFKIPLMSGERVSYCVSLFLTYVVLLNSIGSSIPKVSGSVSYLQLYVNIQFGLGMITTALSIFMVNLSHKCEGRQIPEWVQTIKEMQQKRQIQAANKQKNNDEYEDPTTPTVSSKNDHSKNKCKLRIGNKVRVEYQTEDECEYFEVLRSIDHWLFGILMFMFISSTVVCFMILLL